ncbi:MAG: IPT/TIG domain-containing protein, partial [Cyclobacteriaceae bacterium]|nr:IPT/TIG domain-containing protein [Cyclobacteriaceae bacterium]
LTFTPPTIPDENYSRWIYVHDFQKWQGLKIKYDNTIIDDCAPYTGWTSGAEIISLQFNEINNTSVKNVTGGRSDYSNKVAIVHPYKSYFADVTVKNFSNVPKHVKVSVYIKNTDLPNDLYLEPAVGQSMEQEIAPNQQAIHQTYFYIPENIPLNENVNLWFVVEYVSFEDGCTSRIGEIEKYSLYARKSPAGSTLKITGLSQPSASPGNLIDVTGTDLDKVTSLQLGSIQMPFTINSPTSIRFTVPVNAITGKVNIASILSDASSDSNLKIVNNHSVTQLNPAVGQVNDVITIKGTNMLNVTSVLFVDIPATSFYPVNNTTLRVKVPAAAKTGSIVLKNELNYAVNSETFHFCDGVTATQFCKI